MLFREGARGAAPAPSAELSDLSQASDNLRQEEIAQELETAALSFPKPGPGTTGEAAIYFPYVIDLIGRCAEPFLWHFAASQSKELRGAAKRWLAFLANNKKGQQCNLPAR